MDINKLCIHCMKESENVKGQPCTHCGYLYKEKNEANHFLRPYSILQGKYLVGDVMGEGGFGITYIGYELNLELRLAIKEFYPNGYASRNGAVTSDVTLCTGIERETILKWKDDFVNEAKMLAKCSDLAGVVGVKDYFQENGTAYIVMEYVEGVTLKEYVKQQGGKLALQDFFRTIEPVLVALGEVHKQGLIHRDISPDNIMLLSDGSMKLLDFGASRQYGDAAKSMSVMLKPGYAPEEQYRSKGNQGPWTDIYAFAGTLYKCITGITPPEAMERLRNDTLQRPSELGIEISKDIEDVLMKALAVYAEDRYQTVEEFHTALYQHIDLQVTSHVKSKAQSEAERKESVYQNSIELMESEYLEDVQNAWDGFRSIGEWKDAKEQAEICEKKYKELETEQTYTQATKRMETAATVMDFQDIAASLEPISDYKNAGELIEQCLVSAEELRKDLMYHNALDLMEKGQEENIVLAKDFFSQLQGWKDAEEKLEECNQRLEELEREKELKREKRKKQLIRIGIAAASTMVLAIVLAIVYRVAIVPLMEKQDKYQAACELFDNKKYEEAIAQFKELNGYKDSENKIKEAEEQIYILSYDSIYQEALSLYLTGMYEESLAKFKEIDNYEEYLDVSDYIAEIKERLYENGKTLFDEGNYLEAMQIFQLIEDYEDVTSLMEQAGEKIHEEKQNMLTEYEQLYADGKYKELIQMMQVLNESLADDEALWQQFENDTETYVASMKAFIGEKVESVEMDDAEEIKELIELLVESYPDDTDLQTYQLHAQRDLYQRSVAQMIKDYDDTVQLAHIQTAKGTKALLVYAENTLTIYEMVDNSLSSVWSGEVIPCGYRTGFNAEDGDTIAFYDDSTGYVAVCTGLSETVQINATTVMGNIYDKGIYFGLDDLIEYDSMNYSEEEDEVNRSMDSNHSSVVFMNKTAFERNNL